MPAEKDTQGAARADLSVVVVTHNRPELALQTLTAARAAADGLTVEWLVVDSGSTDDTPRAIERTWSDIAVARLENVGFAAANNHALQSARGRYVLLLNPDCTVAEGTLAELVAQLDCRPEVGLASVVQRAPDGSLQYSIRRYPSPWLALGEALGGGRLAWTRDWREEDTREQSYKEERPVDWLVGAFLIARREAIQEVGPLDTRFFLYSEEIDWCYRFREAGWDVRHLPVMTVTHHTGNEHRPDLLAQLSYAKVLFAQKHYGSQRARAIRSALMLRHALRVIACGALGLARPVWGSRKTAERHALAVVSGRADPPFGGARPQTSVSA
jgi:GT2 family glycosyltransferase